MIESHLNNEMIIEGEPQLASMYATNQSDWGSFQKEAWRKLTNDFSVRKYNLRKLCKRLPLQASVTKTENYSGSLSDEDFASRGRWVIKVTETNGAATFTLKGKNDESDSYESIDELSISEVGTYSIVISDNHQSPGVYKFYAVDVSLDSATSITYESYLVEDVYTLLHLYLTRALVYFHLRNKNQTYKEKHEEYMALYLDYMDSGYFPYDQDDDGEISESESDDSFVEVKFTP